MTKAADLQHSANTLQNRKFPHINTSHVHQKHTWRLSV